MLIQNGHSFQRGGRNCSFECKSYPSYSYHQSKILKGIRRALRKYTLAVCNFWTVCPTDLCLTVLEMAAQFLKSRGDQGLPGLPYDGAPGQWYVDCGNIGCEVFQVSGIHDWVCRIFSPNSTCFINIRDIQQLCIMPLCI